MVNKTTLVAFDFPLVGIMFIEGFKDKFIFSNSLISIGKQKFQITDLVNYYIDYKGNSKDDQIVIHPITGSFAICKIFAAKNCLH